MNGASGRMPALLLRVINPEARFPKWIWRCTLLGKRLLSALLAVLFCKECWTDSSHCSSLDSRESGCNGFSIEKAQKP